MHKQSAWLGHQCIAFAGFKSILQRFHPMSEHPNSTKRHLRATAPCPVSAGDIPASTPDPKVAPERGTQTINRINFKQPLISAHETKASATLLNWDKNQLWDATLAAKLIALGGPVDIDSELQLDASDPPAPSMAVAYSCCLKEIELSKGDDASFPMVASPRKWLIWALEHDYDISHLISILPKDQVPRQFPKDAVVVNGHDHDELATPDSLIKAFGTYTGMDQSWFDKPEGRLLKAKKSRGTSGRRSHQPRFCPYEVMEWLISPKRKKGQKISVLTGWRQLKKHFSNVYDRYESFGPELE